MRKVKGLIWMMMAVALTACSSDDESAPLTVNALAGEYIGEATGTLVSINEKASNVVVTSRHRVQRQRKSQ